MNNSKNSEARLIYGYDALCGWCYGFIPALRALAKSRPYLQIDVVPGGLFTGDRAQPYTHLVDHITRAFPLVTKQTGQAPSKKFWKLIRRENAPIANSTIPNMAVALMNEQYPERALEYAHRLQEIHFVEAMDLNKANTYDVLSKRYDFPKLATSKIVNALENNPLIAKSYLRSAKLGINSYPSVLNVDENDVVLKRLRHSYNPAELIENYN